jgi:uncharacterized protein YceK
MKQFIILAILITLMASCGGIAPKTTPATDSVAVDTASIVVDSVKTDTVK